MLKKYDCTNDYLADSVNEMNLRIKEGLAQARVDHPHVCKLLEVRIDINRDGHYSVSHILEALDNDVNQVIEERKKANRPYTETELRTFLFQVSEALTYMHNKVSPRQNIAHRNIQPANVFFTNGIYKVGDFAHFWEKESLGDLFAENGTGTPLFMSPQFKASARGLGTQYQPFKTDVYSLGATVLNLAALTPPLYLNDEVRLDEVVQQEVGRLRYSEEFKAMLLEMLSTDEESRPLMQKVEKENTLSDTLQISERGNKFVLAPFSPKDIRLDPNPIYRNANLGQSIKGSAFCLRVNKQRKKE